MAFLLLAVISVIAVHVTAAPPKWIDLSYPFVENETIYWPDSSVTPFWIKVGFQGEAMKDTYILHHNFGANEHGGTHMDAPNHFIKDGISVDKIKFDQIVGDGIVVNISVKAEKNPNAELEVSDLEDWEKKHGRIPDKSVVFMYSGWGKYYPDKVKYYGTNSTEDPNTFNFPGLHPDAAKWLIDKRIIKMFGSDTRSLGKGQNTALGFPTHKALLGAGVPGIEMAANLDRLPPKGFEVFAAPMKIQGGTGGPTRVFARIADKTEVSASTHARMSQAFVATVMAIALIVCF